MNQQNHDFQEDEVTTGNFELLEDVEADARVNRNVPAGTLFLTLSGKLPVERLRPGMTVLDSVGHQRDFQICIHPREAALIYSGLFGSGSSAERVVQQQPTCVELGGFYLDQE